MKYSKPCITVAAEFSKRTQMLTFSLRNFIDIPSTTASLININNLEKTGLDGGQ